MAHVEVSVTHLDIGAINSIEAHTPRSFLLSKPRQRLEITAMDGTVVEADVPKEAPPDALGLLEFAWLCLTYGAEGSDHEAALADLRAAKAAHDAREAARRAA